MEKISNIQQATEYVYKQLKEVNSEIQKDDVYDTIMEEILASVEYILTEEDVRFLEENEKDTTAIEEYFESKIPEYKELLTEIVADMVGEEIVWEA